MRRRDRLIGDRGVLCGLGMCFWLLASCTAHLDIPIVSDDSLEQLVKNEVERIVAVSDDKKSFSQYRIFLSDFPRKDILGMSFGNRRIYISHRLANLAAAQLPYLWLLRQTLAHEIAHEAAGHAEQTRSAFFNRSASQNAVSNTDVGLPQHVRLYNYPMEKELEADAKGLEYWSELGWDCRIWVGILQNFEKQQYAGDALHPTDLRLEQARRACPDETQDGMI